MQTPDTDIPSRVSNLERDVVDIAKEQASQKASIRAGLAIAVFMAGGYFWYANKSVDKLEQMVHSVNAIQTDVLLIKKDGERKDWERKLINLMVKKGGGSDVSSSQERE